MHPVSSLAATLKLGPVLLVACDREAVTGELLKLSLAAALQLGV